MNLRTSDNLKGACAVVLILTSIALAFYQTISTADIANGVLMYIAQAFLLAGSLFGLDYYVKKLKTNEIEYEQTNSTGHSNQLPVEHSQRPVLVRPKPYTDGCSFLPIPNYGTGHPGSLQDYTNLHPQTPFNHGT